MNNRPAIPFHETILDQLRNNPAKGKSLLTIFLKNPTTSTESKLQIMALLLAQFGESTAVQVVHYLPVDPKVIPKPLAELTLEPVLIDNLIEFLSRKKYKLLREGDKGQLYFDLYRAAVHLKDDEKKMHYLLKAAEYPDDLHTLDLHLVHYSLGLRYAIADDVKNAELHFKKAIDLEKNNKALFKNDNQILVVKTQLNHIRTSPFELGDSQYSMLRLLIDLEPQDPRIIETIYYYLDKTLFSAHSPALSDKYLMQFFYFLKRYPNLETKFQQLGEFLLQLPEETCSFRKKVNYFYLLRQYEHVIEVAQVALQKDEYDYQILICLAESLRQLKRKQEAIHYYKKALDCQLQGNEQGLVLSHLASLNLELGNYVEAKEYEDAYTALNPNSYYSQLINAKKAFHNGHRQKSKKIFSAMQKQFPEQKKDIQDHLNIYFEDGKEDFDRERDPYLLSLQVKVNQIKGNYATAEAIGLFLLSKDPSDIMTTLCLVAIYEAQGRWDDSLKLYLSLNEKEQGRYSFEVANVYCELQQYGNAESFIWSFLRDPRSYSKETFSKREKAVSLLLAIFCENCKNCEDFENTISILSKALEDSSLSLSPSEEQFLHFGLAMFYHCVDPLKEADEIQKALLCQEEVPPVFNKLLGEFYYDSERMEDAVTFLTKAMHSYPQDTTILLNLGAALYISDPSQRDKALSYFSTVLKQDPSKLPDILEFSLSEEDSNALLDKFSLKEKNEPQAAAEEDSSDEEVEEEKHASSFSSKVLTPLPPSSPSALTPEQIAHRHFQALKRQLKASVLEQKDSEEAGWQLPSGFLSVNDPRVFKIAIAQHLRADSCLYAFVDLDALRKACPQEELLSRCQKIVEEGQVARSKRKQQGILFFNKQRTAKTGSIAQIKLLGLHGDARIRGKLIPGPGNIQLLHFDTAILKAH